MAGRLGDLARLVGSYERAATAWIYEERRLLEARDRLELADQLVVQAESRCEGSEEELDERRAALASAKERVATMQQIVDDPTGREVLGRLEAAEGDSMRSGDSLRNWRGAGTGWSRPSPVPIAPHPAATVTTSGLERSAASPSTHSSGWPPPVSSVTPPR